MQFGTNSSTARAECWDDSIRDHLSNKLDNRATVIGQSLGGGVAMQFAYQINSRNAASAWFWWTAVGWAGRSPFYLRMLTVPGFEHVFPFFCTPRLRDAGNLVASWLGRAGVRSTPASQEIWRSYASLADDGFANVRILAPAAWGGREPVCG